MLHYGGMNLTIFLLLYILSVPIFFVIDMVWLGYIARGFYQRQIGHVLGAVNWPAAIGFYLIYLVGVTYFATYPAFLHGDWTTAVMVGGLFGFFTYATYDMTNLATLPQWPVQIVVVDVLWGTVLGASVSGITYAAAMLLIG